jgi:hypothetical protein
MNELSLGAIFLFQYQMAQGQHKTKSSSQIMKKQEQKAKKINRTSRGLRKNPKGAGLAREKAMEKVRQT